MAEEKRFDSEPVRTSRDRRATEHQLTAWLRTQVDDPGASIANLTTPSGSGMSSETLLFDASWAGNPSRALVARLEPVAADTPVFPTYDLDLQFRVMQLVAEHSDVPVPTPLWIENDPGPLGTPFFVMERVSGRVPADIPPYVFEGWLVDASPDEQHELERASIDIIADVSSIDLTGLDVAFLETPSEGATPLHRHVNYQRWFYDWVCRGERSHPIIDEAFAWLDANWPDEGPAVISWGDARIGNVMFAADGFTPVAVFDWEMASLAPVEVDLAWISFLHEFFQSIATAMGLAGLTDVFSAEAVRGRYHERTGRVAGDLSWFRVYAALRHAIIMSRIKDRSVRFGESEWPDDIDSVIPHRDVLAAMIR